MIVENQEASKWLGKSIKIAFKRLDQRENRQNFILWPTKMGTKWIRIETFKNVLQKQDYTAYKVSFSSIGVIRWLNICSFSLPDLFNHLKTGNWNSQLQKFLANKNSVKWVFQSRGLQPHDMCAGLVCINVLWNTEDYTGYAII